MPISSPFCPFRRRRKTSPKDHTSASGRACPSCPIRIFPDDLLAGDEKVDFDTGYALSGALGYRFANGSRVEGEVGYRRNNAYKLSGTLAGITVICRRR